MKTGKKFLPAAFLAILTIAALASCSGGGSNDTILTTPIDVNTLYVNVTIPAYDTHYYDFIAAGNGSHTIELTNLETVMDWTLFTNPSYSDPNVIDMGPMTSADQITSTVALTAGVRYYLMVDEWDIVPGEYDLRVAFP